MGAKGKTPKNHRLQADDVLLYAEVCSQYERGATSLSDIADRINGSPEAVARLGTKKKVTLHQITQAQVRLQAQLGYGSETELICTDNGGIRQISVEGREAYRWCQRFTRFLTLKPPRKQRAREAVAVGGSILHDIVPPLLRELETRGHTPSQLAFDTFVPRFIADQLITRRVVMGVAWYGGELAGKEFDGADAVFRKPIGAEVPVALLLPHGHALATGSPGSRVPAESLADQALIYPPLTPLRRMAKVIPVARRVRVADLPGVARQVASGLGVGLYPAHPVHLRPATSAYGLTWRVLQPPAAGSEELHRPLRLCVYTSRELAAAEASRGLLPEAIFAALQTVVEHSEQAAGGWHIEAGPVSLTAGQFGWLFLGMPDGRFITYQFEREHGTVRAETQDGTTVVTFRALHQSSATVLFAADERPGQPLSLTFLRRTRGRRDDQLCLCGGGVFTTPSGSFLPVTAVLSVTRLEPIDLAELRDLAPNAAGSRAGF
jgi:hypothetical protein